MPIGVGQYELEIVSNAVRSLAGKSAASIILRNEVGEEIESLIFLTPKAMNMARAQLKRCGFDVDTQDLEELAAVPNLLAGKRVPIKVELYNGRPQARINLDAPPPQDELKRLTAALRAAKDKSEGPSFVDDAPPLGDGDIPF